MLWLMSFTTYTSAAAARAEGVALIKNPCGVEISLVRVNTDDREMPRHSAAALLRGLALSILFLLTGSLKFCIAQQSSTVYNDTKTLLEFKASADPHNSLVDWSSSDCCLPSSPWIGVTCQQGRVWRLVLAGVPLSGDMEALSSLSELRVLSISDSKLHGFLPNLSNWRFLWLLNLSSNMLSGPIPLSIGSLTRLWRVDLSRNLFSGAIPSSINSLPRLLTLSVHSNALNGSIPSLRLPSLTSLFLQQNNLSGSIPPLYLPNLTSFDVSANNLSGLIPSSLTNFPPTAFLGNVNLCGRPLGPCKNSIMSNPASPMLVPSHPGTFHPHPPSSKVTSKLSYGAIIAIVIGDVIILLLLILIFVVYYWKRGHSYGEVCKKTKAEEDAHYLSSLQVPDMNDRNKLVFFSDVRRFELEDLLRASAEMLGKGSFGTTYKAVLEDGHAVTVKRLKEIAPSGRREFDQHMQLIGSLHHPNIVPLRAYYSAKDEKLLVYDYMPNGSLYTLLHGNKGPNNAPLDWAARSTVAFGTAKGLAYLHEESAAAKFPHGNVKSSNILIDRNGNPCIADIGLTSLINAATPQVSWLGYRAPELGESKKVSHKADVYSYGVLLLELLTGRTPAKALRDDGIDLPRWVQSVVREEWTAEVFDVDLMHLNPPEDHLVSLLQVAMACVSTSPEQRPTMAQVVSMIQGISLPVHVPVTSSPSSVPSPSPPPS